MTTTESKNVSFLRLKYGSTSAIYRAWDNMSFAQAEEEFGKDGYELIIKYELQKWQENRHG